MKNFFNKKYSLFLLLVFLVTACSNIKNIVIEIPEPAKKELPNRIQSLLLVNRTVDDKYSDLPSDVLQEKFYKSNFKLDTIIYDSTAVDTCLKALGNLLYESGRYDVVIPENRFLAFQKNSFFSNKMSFQEAKELCTTYNTDAILAIDMFSTKISTRYFKDYAFDSDEGDYTPVKIAQIAISYDALFRVYDPLREKVLLREFLKDTLVWEEARNTTRSLFKYLTPIKRALSEAGVAAALDFSEQIGTNWRKEKRPIFVKGNKKLKLAGNLLDNGDWKQAMALWKEIEESSASKSTKSKAELNLSIAYEIENDIDNAIKWGVKSYKTMYRKVTYEYLELLKRRKKELQKQTK